MSTQAYYQGNYVNDMRDLVVASMVIGRNSLLICGPGWGKTDISYAVMRQVYGDDFCSIRLHNAAQPELFQGPPDVEEMLKNNRFAYNLVDTPYNPRFKAVHIDEVGRGNNVVYSLMMHVMDRKGLQYPVPVICTANFLPKGEEHKALLDRIGLWHYVSTTSLTEDEAAAIVDVQLSRNESDPPLMVAGKVPTWQDLQDIYDMHAGVNARKAISDAIKLVTLRAKEEGYYIHPRRVEVWGRNLARMGFWLTGQEDFTTLPNEALKTLRFAYPAESEADYAKWKNLILSVEDPIAAALEDTLGNAVIKINEAIKRCTTPAERMAQNSLLLDTDAVLAELAKQYPNDKRIADARAEVTGWFASLARGTEIKRA